LVCFALGLMAKPMLVALPFVLLLIDYWPLQRFYLPDQTQSGAIQDRAEQRKLLTRILVDKVPMIIMSMFSSWVTLKAASSGGAVKATSIFPLIGRIENAIISYAMYLYKMVWPTDLAIFYPYPIGRPVWHVTLSIFFLTAITIFICLKGRKYRYLITGWFWYLITLLPVIGLVQVGFQSMANRYAYIPLIGIFIVIVWGLSDFLKRFSGRQYTEAVAFAMILALAFCTKSTLPDWKNSERVFMQALNVTKNNHIAEMGMGNVWLGRGDLIKAGSHYLGALLLKPDYAEAHNNLALVLLRLGKVDEAAAQYREALKDNPDYAEAYNNLGAVLAGQGKWKEAEESFRRSLKSKPHYTGARSNLAKLFLQQGKIEESIKHFHAALEVEPDNAELKKNLEDALHQILTQKKSRSEVR
jgi:Tfp pilus assembly protein PilF